MGIIHDFEFMSCEIIDQYFVTLAKTFIKTDKLSYLPVGVIHELALHQYDSYIFLSISYYRYDLDYLTFKVGMLDNYISFKIHEC
jgi:hypothetical protein